MERLLAWRRPVGWCAAWALFWIGHVASRVHWWQLYIPAMQRSLLWQEWAGDTRTGDWWPWGPVQEKTL